MLKLRVNPDDYVVGIAHPTIIENGARYEFSRGLVMIWRLPQKINFLNSIVLVNTRPNIAIFIVVFTVPHTSKILHVHIPL